ncbi:hypothetical protein BN2476_680069 [Paraburkholderia piptadeniae]|uniref:Uncharacterized protein n=1 Tax=Paraburkholderia piptadeniae TaxID=1701573 RepID=A0A1N7SPP4_9BURK|nr:hypothetical protein BN2476_680069 [Paraburkholderia piptadeniae]
MTQAFAVVAIDLQTNVRKKSTSSESGALLWDQYQHHCHGSSWLWPVKATNRNSRCRLPHPR